MTAKKINALGFLFEEHLDVKGRISIAEAFLKSKPRCGIYLLSFSDKTFYIGQAIDVVKRFSQHRKRYDNIVKLWFQPVRKSLLNETEQRLIQQAELSKMLLTNKTFVSNVIGDTDLDLIIPPARQDKWLEGNRQISNGDFDLYSTIEPKYKIKYRENFRRFEKLADYAELKKLLRLYITKCLPAYKKTEMSFWSLSCMPSTFGGERAFCLNLNGMEVFVVGHDKKTGKAWCFMTVSNHFRVSVRMEKAILKRYPSLKIEASSYQAAGPDQVMLRFADLQELKTVLLQEKEVVTSIKELNLRLMRKGATRYSAYHCFDLVQDVIGSL